MLRTSGTASKKSSLQNFLIQNSAQLFVVPDVCISNFVVSLFAGIEKGVLGLSNDTSCIPIGARVMELRVMEAKKFPLPPQNERPVKWMLKKLF